MGLESFLLLSSLAEEGTTGVEAVWEPPPALLCRAAASAPPQPPLARGPAASHGERGWLARTPIPAPVPVPFLPSQQLSPAPALGVGVPQPIQQQEPSIDLPNCAAPSLTSTPASVSLPGRGLRAEPRPGPSSDHRRDIVEKLYSPRPRALPFPKCRGSPLPAPQLGSGLRCWLGEAFFPRCNFSLLHKVCSERCLEASHPPLGCRGGGSARRLQMEVQASGEKRLLQIPAR